MLICRSIDKPDLMLKRCRDIVNSSDGLIIVIDDGDIAELLRLRAVEGDKGVSDYMQSKLDEILM